MIEYFNEYSVNYKIVKNRQTVKSEKPNLSKLRFRKKSLIIREEIIIKLWKYAINSIIFLNLRAKFIEYFKMILKQKKKPEIKIFTKEEYENFRRIIKRVNINDLTKWTQIAIDIYLLETFSNNIPKKNIFICSSKKKKKGKM